MLYRVLCDKNHEDIAILGVRKNDILRRRDMFITTGNAASPYSDIFPASQIKKILREIDKNIRALESQIEEKEQRKIEIEEKLADASVYTNQELSRDLNIDYRQIIDDLSTLYEKWEALGES